MWDLIVSVPDQCFSFYSDVLVILVHELLLKNRICFKQEEFVIANFRSSFCEPNIDHS